MKSEKRFEILLAATNQNDDSVLDKMKVNSDIIVCNQNYEKFNKKIYKKNNYNVEWYNFSERGVGLNRNNALMRSKAEICLLSDDDVTYVDKYEKIILDQFDAYPKADVILFNIYSRTKNKRFICKKKMNINHLNCGKFGGVRIAFRRSKVIKKSISFNLLFGGGALFSAGEDVMFIHDCLKKGLKVIAVPDFILSLREERDSTWFQGYNKKFFSDLGSSYCRHYGMFAYPFACIQLARKRNLWLNQINKKDAKKIIKEGIRIYKEL